jgi:hypothetical protein
MYCCLDDDAAVRPSTLVVLLVPWSEDLVLDGDGGLGGSSDYSGLLFKIEKLTGNLMHARIFVHSHMQQMPPQNFDIGGFVFRHSTMHQMLAADFGFRATKHTEASRRMFSQARCQS